MAGDNGDDSLTAGAGDDRIDGGFGDDLMSGGEGADVFIFTTEEVLLDGGTARGATDSKLGFGQDVITDFEIGVDKIDLRKVAGITNVFDEDLKISDVEGGAFIEIGEGDILLDGVLAAELSHRDFLFDQSVVVEYGSIEVDQEFVTVDLEADFENPVVLAFVDGIAQQGIITTRIQNVDSDSFEIRIQASDDFDAVLAPETVDFMVVEAGVHTLENGAVLEAGIVTADQVH